MDIDEISKEIAQEREEQGFLYPTEIVPKVLQRICDKAHAINMVEKDVYTHYIQEIIFTNKLWFDSHKQSNQPIHTLDLVVVLKDKDGKNSQTDKVIISEELIKIHKLVSIYFNTNNIRFGSIVLYKYNDETNSEWINKELVR